MCVDGAESLHACRALGLSQAQTELVCRRWGRSRGPAACPLYAEYVAIYVAAPHDSSGAQPIFQLYKADTPLFLGGKPPTPPKTLLNPELYGPSRLLRKRPKWHFFAQDK